MLRRIRLLLTRSQSGFIMITAYLMLSVASVLSYAMFSRNTVFMQAVERNQNKMVAFNLADAGVDYAIKQLADDPAFSGVGYTALNSYYSSGGYEITVSTPESNSNVREITVTGYSPSNDSTAKNFERRTVVTYVEYAEDSSYFQAGIFAKNSVTMSGNAQVDSYNSNDGAYGGSNVGSNGDVATDSTTAGTVTLSGNVVINGDIEVGPDGDPNSVISTSGNTSITGETGSADALKGFEPAETDIASSGALSLNGNTNYSLAAGTYHYDSISISGNARVNVLGPVTIYVSGTVSISGNGFTNTTLLPKDCLIYSTSNKSVSISGNGNFYGAIYAPNSAVSNTGNGAIYGAVVANTYHQTGNGNVHFDEALKELGGADDSSMNILAWQEQSTSSWNTGT